MSPESEPVYRAWCRAHHAVACAYKNVTEWERCRYRAAHLVTARKFAEELAKEGYELRSIVIEPQSVPMWGDL